MELTQLPPDAAYVTLASVPGIGRARLELLLNKFGSAANALEASYDALRGVPTLSKAAATAIKSADIETGTRIIRRTDALGAHVLIPSDARFPTLLKAIPDAPTMLFALGQVNALNADGVAIVGSRDHTRYGAAACRHFAGAAARAGLVVVSGLARGLDAVAHDSCLEAGGRTVGVLGNGLGIVYPAANRALYDRVASDGCLLTEFPPGERPHAGSFPRRNRLISGLAQAVLVIEARITSGALITADCALAQAREVLAVPGPITSPMSAGCNRLIQQGAKAALELRDMLEEYGLSDENAVAPGVRIPNNLGDAERRVLDVLDAGGEHVDNVARRLRQPPAEVLAVLTSLEIRGLVNQEPGKVFRRRSALEA